MKKIKEIFFFVVLLVVGIFMIVTGTRDYKNSKRIIAEGKDAVGKVTNSEEHRGRRGRRSYYITAVFQTEAKQSVEQELKVDRAVYTKATESGTVPVHYLPSDPNICAFGEKAETKFGTIVWGAIALVGSLVLLKGVFDFGGNTEPSTVGSIPATQVAQNNQSAPAPVEADDSEDSFEEAA
jgi:hypothetical protein